MSQARDNDEDTDDQQEAQQEEEADEEKVAQLQEMFPENDVDSLRNVLRSRKNEMGSAVAILLGEEADDDDEDNNDASSTTTTNTEDNNNDDNSDAQESRGTHRSSYYDTYYSSYALRAKAKEAEEEEEIKCIDLDSLPSRSKAIQRYLHGAPLIRRTVGCVPTWNDVLTVLPLVSCLVNSKPLARYLLNRLEKARHNSIRLNWRPIDYMAVVAECIWKSLEDDEEEKQIDWEERIEEYYQGLRPFDKIPEARDTKWLLSCAADKLGGLYRKETAWGVRSTRYDSRLTPLEWLVASLALDTDFRLCVEVDVQKIEDGDRYLLSYYESEKEEEGEEGSSEREKERGIESRFALDQATIDRYRWLNLRGGAPLLCGLSLSTQTCLSCAHQKHLLERFAEIQLSVDVHPKRVIVVTYVPYQLTVGVDKPTKYRLSVPKSGKGVDLKRALIERLGISLSTDELEIADVYSGRVFQIFDDDKSLSLIKDTDIIIAYQQLRRSLLFSAPNSSNSVRGIHVVHRFYRTSKYNFYISSASGGMRWTIVGNPIVVPNWMSGKHVYRFVWDRFKTFLGFEENLSYDKYLQRLDDEEREERERQAAKEKEKEENGEKGKEKEEQEEEKGEKEEETEEERRKREIEEQLKKDEELARKLQEEWSNSTQRTTSYGSYQSYVGSALRSNDAEVTAGREAIRGIFDIKAVGRYGGTCGRCTQTYRCTGCVQPYDDSPIQFSRDFACLAVDWNLTDEQYQMLENSEGFTLTPAVFENDLENMLPSIYDCVNAYLSVKQLPNNQRWYCDKCKCHREAIVSTELVETPEILVFNLEKRSSSYYYRSEYTTMDFPLRSLDLGPYMMSRSQYAPNKTLPRPIYDLVGLVYVEKRNYCAAVKNVEDNQWYWVDAVGSQIALGGDGDIDLKTILCSSDVSALAYQRKTAVLSLKDMCLLMVARARAHDTDIDDKVVSCLPIELRELLDEIKPIDARYFA